MAGLHDLFTAKAANSGSVRGFRRFGCAYFSEIVP